MKRKTKTRRRNILAETGGLWGGPDRFRGRGLIHSKGQKKVASMLRKRRRKHRSEVGGLLGELFSARTHKKKSSGRGVSGVTFDVMQALRGQGFSQQEAKRRASRARGSDFDSKFRDALRSNPMAKKKARKRRQPAALAKYWASRRKKKNSRPRRRNARRIKLTTLKPRRRRRTVVRRRVVRRRRRVARNPRKRVLKLNLSLGPKQKRTLASFLRRATGRRVKVR